MSLYLHGIGGDRCPISANDALAKEVGDDKVDMVLANPPYLFCLIYGHFFTNLLIIIRNSVDIRLFE